MQKKLGNYENCYLELFTCMLLLGTDCSECSKLGILESWQLGKSLEAVARFGKFWSNVQLVTFVTSYTCYFCDEFLMWIVNDYFQLQFVIEILQLVSNILWCVICYIWSFILNLWFVNYDMCLGFLETLEFGNVVNNENCSSCNLCNLWKLCNLQPPTWNL